MPQHAARNGARAKPPGGRRASGAEVQARLDFADKMLRDGHPRAEVVASMASTFGLSTRAADSYIARARERWAEESKDAREVERAAALARLDRLSGKAETRGAFSAAVSAEKLRAQVNGLLAPQAVEVNATLAQAAPACDESMSAEDIDNELTEIALFCAASLRQLGAQPSAKVVENVRALARAVGVLPEALSESPPP